MSSVLLTSDRLILRDFKMSDLSESTVPLILKSQGSWNGPNTIDESRILSAWLFLSER